MHREKQLSPTHEMYLKVLYQVRADYEVARVRDISQGLGVNPGTVTSTLKRLEKMGFVKHDRYGVVVLTPTGVNVAECMIRRFETIKGLLTEVLGVDPEVAEIDACMMEHAVSPATVNRMESMVFLARSGKLEWREALAQVQRGGSVCEDKCEQIGACQAAAAGNLRLVTSKVRRS